MLPCITVQLVPRIRQSIRILIIPERISPWTLQRKPFKPSRIN